MLKHLLSTTAIVLALSTSAWAQTATSDQPAAGQTTQEMDMQGGDQPAAGAAGSDATTQEPAAGTAETDTGTTEPPATGTAETDTGTTEPPAAGTADTGTEEPATGTAETDTGAEKPAAGGGEAVIAAEEPGQLKAEDLMGMSVISGQGEKIGEVKDLIFSQDEKITGVVVGVGGFLGIGEKMVGLNWDQAEVQQNPDTGEDVVVVSMTKEELEAAPEFKTEEDQKAEEEAAQPATTTPAQPMTGQ